MKLIVVSSAPVWKSGDRLIFDRKFYEGILLYVDMWPGSIKCIAVLSDEPLPDFGIVNLAYSEAPFECMILEKNTPIAADHLSGATLVYASGDSFEQFHISSLCASQGIKCVYIIENIPETRYQMAALSTTNPLVRLRRYAYLWFGERRRLRAFAMADGLHSNGVPAHNEYRKFENNLLYFDTRVHEAEMIPELELEHRLEELQTNRPLRLAFSGRLIRMKGADHLIALAAMLHKAGTQFHLNIYGSGDLEEEMKSMAMQYHLDGMVTFAGAVDFHNRLLPELKAQIDLFICLHRQSDPSCTYLETLSCGVPILGYKNKAFAGLLEEAEIGWGVTPDDLNSIKENVIWLDQHRDDLAKKAKNSARFARSHSFETTFKKRIQHLVHLCS